MKNLAELYKNHLEFKNLEYAEYQELMAEVIDHQLLFTLTSCEQDTGLLLRSYDGSFHIWFVGTVISLEWEGKRWSVVETGVWSKHQLDEAMKDLMLQMCIDCEGLIEREGETA